MPRRAGGLRSVAYAKKAECVVVRTETHLHASTLGARRRQGVRRRQDPERTASTRNRSICPALAFITLGLFPVQAKMDERQMAGPAN